MARFFHSLRYRLILLIFLAMFPTFVLAIYTASAQRQLVYEQAQAEALRFARSAAQQQNDLIESVRQLLFVLSQIPAIRGDDPQTCRDNLAMIIKNNPRYTNIIKTDIKGKYICDAYSAQQNLKLTDDLLADRVLYKKGFIIGRFLISPSTGLPVINFGYPILDENKNVSAIIATGLDLTILNQSASQALLPAGSTITVRDRNGTILARYPDPTLWIGLTKSDAQITQAMESQGTEGTVEARGEDGTLRLYAFTPVLNSGEADLTVTVGIPTAVAYAKVNKLLVQNLFLLGAVTILVFAAAWFGVDYIFIRQVRSLADATKHMSSGDLSARSGLRYEEGELGQLAQVFDQMADVLEKRDRELDQTMESLRKEEHIRARLLHQVITAHEDERIRIARELHDETSQSLSALLVGLDSAIIAQEKDHLRVAEHILSVKAIADGMLVDIHRLINNLRPALLDDLGLSAAITVCAEKQLRPFGISIHVEEDGIDDPLPSVIKTALFRIVQEALTNVVRHSSASKVTIKLTCRDRVLCLEMNDDGIGFDLNTLSSDPSEAGFGLLGMRERVNMLCGDFQITTSPGKGTNISVKIPVPLDKCDNA